MTFSLFSFTIIFILDFCGVPVNKAQTCDSLMLCEIQKIAGSNEAFDELPHFGYSIATSGSYMIVGEPGPFQYVQDYSKWVGKAYIYEKSNNLWSKVKTLTSLSSTGMDFFGYSVDISDNFAIIGAYTYDDSDVITDSGAAYIIERNENTGLWGDLYKLSLDTSIKNDHYGYSVGISAESEYAVVGARYNDDVGSSSGKVYIYERHILNIETEWILVQELIASDAKSGDKFGSSVAIDNNYIIIGAPEYSYNGQSNIGAGYIFYNNGSMWDEEQILIASDASSSDYLGKSVDISENGYAILGAPDYDGDDLTNNGRVYIWSNDIDNLWTQITIPLTPSDNAFGDKFGWSVRLYSDTYKTQALIGAYINDDLGTNAGTAYLYSLCNDQWIESQKIYGSDTDLDDRFGGSVAITENEVNIGAYRKNGANGTVYTFDYQNICPTAEPIITTESPDISDNALFVGCSFTISFIFVVLALMY